MIFAISTFRFCSFYFGANRREDKTFLTLMQPRIPGGGALRYFLGG